MLINETFKIKKKKNLFFFNIQENIPSLITNFLFSRLVLKFVLLLNFNSNYFFNKKKFLLVNLKNILLTDHFFKRQNLI
jgi:hypothetical protein